jgi:hypothetical protein
MRRRTTIAAALGLIGLVGAVLDGSAPTAETGATAELKSRVWDVSQQDYIAARRFIESLAYEVRSPAS